MLIVIYHVRLTIYPVDGSIPFSLRSISSSAVPHLSIIIYHRRDIIEEISAISRLRQLDPETKNTRVRVVSRWQKLLLLPCSMRFPPCLLRRPIFTETALFSEEDREISKRGFIGGKYIRGAINK